MGHSYIGALLIEMGLGLKWVLSKVMRMDFSL